MHKPDQLAVNEARRAFPYVLDQAILGHPTLITRHGKVVAAVVPADESTQDNFTNTPTLLDLRGSGQTWWGKDVAKTIRKLREEW